MKNVYKALLCMFACPVLGVLSVGLAICSIVSLIGGIARTFGVGFRMDIWDYGSVPTLLSIPVAALFSLLLLFIAFLAWKLLKQSVSFVKS
ncbi:hypothetical protein NCCP2222_37580 [Sporosarcina sp. NCCP-2222]|uniref:hypothetical protein n=1 Tax=Sporosarcina sp. NCCP-2222 TaxID=2935073 RepID=UPI002082D5EC|nr:hypothetical protein [Sporosarcina sp. NCCP-2222]GKV57811.1 hypothetical protein NCCP2222_37580 [Sporosarcina sp. NCCP-2222]